MFILLTLALAIITVLFLLLPLFSKKQQQQLVERDAVNVESAATRLDELKQELENGLINEEQFKRHQLEVETSALEDLRDSASVDVQKRSGNKAVAIIVALVVPLFAIAVYQQLGSEAAFDVALQEEEEPTITAEEIEKMLTVLEEQVKSNPNDVDGRIALSQIYFQLERYNEATKVYSELNLLRPDDPDIMVNFAELLARSHGNNLKGKPTELLNKALTIEPKHPRALWLAGFAEQQAGNKEAALIHWRPLLSMMEEGTEARQHLEKLITDIENNEAKPQTVANNQKSESNQSLQVTVSLSKELQTKVDPNTTLFIFAKASAGPPMPLAVHRGLAKDLPITITLDDSMAMMPQMTLSSFPKVIVAARLSSNGQPQGQAGDFEGFSDVIDTETSSAVDILINNIKP